MYYHLLNMNTNYIIPANFNGTDRQYYDELKTFKGPTDVTFTFSAVASGDIPILKIIADLNNDTPVIIKDFSYDDPEKMKQPIFGRYEPTDSYHYMIYYPTFIIVFANFTKLYYQIPIRVGKSSFYSEYEKLTLASCQFIDNSDNSMFLTLDTLKGDILNLKIK